MIQPKRGEGRESETGESVSEECKKYKTNIIKRILKRSKDLFIKSSTKTNIKGVEEEQKFQQDLGEFQTLEWRGG